MLKGQHTGTAGDKLVIVGAHYDTTSQTRGVDDNGSGVTALLQVAKKIGKVIALHLISILHFTAFIACFLSPAGNSGCEFKHTILFVAFDFEEDTAESEHPIPFGSQYFVQNLTEHLRWTGGTVKGALILEMLANHNETRGNLPRTRKRNAKNECNHQKTIL